MPSWIDFVKDYAKKNNIKYGDAFKKAKPSWEKHKKENPDKPPHKKKPMQRKKKK